jgi:hypothetical protein
VAATRRWSLAGMTKLQNCKIDASVKSILPARFWSVAVVLAAFFGLLAVASRLR